MKNVFALCLFVNLASSNSGFAADLKIELNGPTNEFSSNALTHSEFVNIVEHGLVEETYVSFTQNGEVKKKLKFFSMVIEALAQDQMAKRALAIHAATALLFDNDVLYSEEDVYGGAQRVMSIAEFNQILDGAKSDPFTSLLYNHLALAEDQDAGDDQSFKDGFCSAAFRLDDENAVAFATNSQR